MNKNKFLKVGSVVFFCILILAIGVVFRGSTFTGGLIAGFVFVAAFGIINSNKSKNKNDERELFIIGKTSRFVMIAMAAFFLVMLALMEKNVISLSGKEVLVYTMIYMAIVSIGADTFNRIKN